MRFLNCLLFLFAAANPALAQRNAYQAESEVNRLLTDAKDAYDNLELDESEAALKNALAVVDRFALQGPVVAELHMQLAIIYQVRDQNSEAAINEFLSALGFDPKVKLDPLVSTPTLVSLFDEARNRAGLNRPVAAPQTQVQVRDSDEIWHKPMTQAQSGESLPVSVTVSDSLNRKIYRVYLNFRSEAAESMQQLEMRPHGEQEFATRVPARFMVGKVLKYYIVAEDRSGNRLATYGSGREPVVVPILMPLSGSDRSDNGDDYYYGSSLENDDGQSSSNRRYVSFGVSLGTGSGYIKDTAEASRNKNSQIQPGFSLAAFHTLIELDFWITKWLSLGGFSRLQFASDFDHLEGGRLKFNVLNSGDHNLMLRVGGGLGHIRHTVTINGLLDTTTEGPYTWTVGAAYRWSFSKHFDFISAIDFYHLLGDSPSYHFDLNLGVAVSF